MILSQSSRPEVQNRGLGRPALWEGSGDEPSLVIQEQGTGILREDVISEWLLLSVEAKKPRDGEAGVGVAARVS